MILRALAGMLCYEAFWVRRLAARGLLGAHLEGLRDAVGQLRGIIPKRREIRRARRVPVARFRRGIRASERMGFLTDAAIMARAVLQVCLVPLRRRPPMVRTALERPLPGKRAG